MQQTQFESHQSTFRDSLRTRQRSYLRDRLQILEDIQTPDLNADAALISGIAQLGSSWASFADSRQRGTGFKPDAVLGEVYRIIKDKLSRETMMAVEKAYFDDEWIATEYYPGVVDDLPQFGDGDESHPNYRLWYLSRLCLQDPFLGANDENWRKIIYALNFLGHLTVLKRFADIRNPVQKEKPLPDGSNLLDVNLRVSWVVHRAFLRALHYRSLRVGREDMGIAQLGMITQLAMLLHCVEVEHVKWTERNVPEHFKGLETTFETVRDKLQGIADEVFTERREMVGGVAWTVDETIRNNVNDAEGFAKTIYENLHIGTSNHEWHFWAHLHNVAEDFEDRMAVEHVEDVLIDRRIVIDDEEWQTYRVLINEGLSYTPSDLENLDLPSQDLIAPLLRKIGQINRFRRNHLLLKDWSKKRPWKQLFYVFDTSDDGQHTHYRPLIKSWYRYGRSLDKISQQVDADSPSTIANVWSGFFPIFPIASHRQSDPTRPQPTLPLYADGCVICMEPFAARETITQLHCHHLFHYSCIQSFWDAGRNYKLDCPLCRRNWRLDHVANVAVEALDVWDNERVLSAEEAREHPDIGELYEEFEEYAVEESRGWRMGDERWAGIEVSWVRRRRERFNKERREGWRERGVGMQGYGDESG